MNVFHVWKKPYAYAFVFISDAFDRFHRVAPAKSNIQIPMHFSPLSLACSALLFSLAEAQSRGTR